MCRFGALVAVRAWAVNQMVYTDSSEIVTVIQQVKGCSYRL